MTNFSFLDKLQFFNAVLDILDMDYEIPHYMRRELAESITAMHWTDKQKDSRDNISPEEAVAIEMGCEEFV